MALSDSEKEEIAREIPTLRDFLTGKFDDEVNRLIGRTKHDQTREPLTLALEAALDIRGAGRVMRLDAAVMAGHMLCARVCFRSIASLREKELRDLIANLTRIGVTSLAGKLAGAVVKRALFLVTSFFENWLSENRQRNLERQVRLWSVRTQRECLKAALPQSKKPKHTSYVSTRHWMPRQPKRKRSWPWTWK